RKGSSMAYENSHISDEELILAADGELSRHRARQVSKHLKTCWSCRARATEMEKAITSFVRAYRDELDPQIPLARGPRAVLTVRLSQLAAERPQTTLKRIFRLDFIPWRAAYVAGIVVLAIGVVMLWPSSRASLAWSPNPQLTPGVTLPVTETDICSKNPRF